MQNQAVTSYSERNFKSVIDKCIGCGRIVEEDGTQFCKTYMQPEAKWRIGICNFATHAKPEINVVTIRVNPLKAAKRASAKGKK
ncbi:MAG: PxxKW family cysteine-rich protein [Desulfocapsaceae bacterium]|nr:PxxKW family cysteine-rich protein [Desulfocapsaceae bacterium]